MTEIADVREVLAAFEDTNRVRLEVRFSVARQVRGTDLLVTMLAYDSPGESGEVPPLASVSVKCSSMNLRAWNAVLIHAMYALDIQLALKEYGSVEPER
jgi:hypothetical protein